MDVGERVRLLRVASGKSQTGLSHDLGLKGNTIVSKVETGRMAVDHDLVEALATALGCTVGFLLRPYDEGLATKPWLRAYADASAKVVDQVLADNVLAHEFVEWSSLQWVPDVLPLFDGDLNDDMAIENFAGHVRTIAEIGEGSVVKNAVRAAERLGCSVLPLESELGRHLGLSQRINGRPFIRLSRAWNADNSHQVPGDRQRFTVSHEVGHLTLHAATPPPMTPEDARRLEKQAHRFAAAFLAPAEPLLDDWGSLGGRVTLGALQKLKATWGVAIKMLVVRFRQLGIIDDDQARSLYRQISARGWNTSEPVEVSNEEPIWLARAIIRAFPAPTSELAQVDAARQFGLEAQHISRWTMWTAPQHGPNVVGFPVGAKRLDNPGRGASRRPRAPANSQDADVIRLTPRTD